MTSTPRRERATALTPARRAFALVMLAMGAALVALMYVTPGLDDVGKGTGTGRTEHVQPYPPCTTEDDPGPCVWDADTQGNGHGRSFVVLPSGHVHYLTESE